MSPLIEFSKPNRALPDAPRGREVGRIGRSRGFTLLELVMVMTIIVILAAVGVVSYVHEIPIDPITSDRDWQTEMGEDTYSRDGGQGIIDVRSNAPGTDAEGVAYADY